ncbi:hypothetical protein [Xylophilus sp.]|uniref:hypothetical protein n=1 Tax=Xylophilus sp. TaxID=2653893 RepID=UPI0013BE282A|nr:hypothetical protein [Xylophilus sp.]KAF1042657.1 MAG: hypothetical protein GAK38_04252 [Xylophilus sp.]
MKMHPLFAAAAAAFAILAAGTAGAQVTKAASEASDAAEHKIEQKRADEKAQRSGPVGKAVNNVKSGYHKERSEHSAKKAKRSLRNATD